MVEHFYKVHSSAKDRMVGGAAIPHAWLGSSSDPGIRAVSPPGGFMFSLGPNQRSGHALHQHGSIPVLASLTSELMGIFRCAPASTAHTRPRNSTHSHSSTEEYFVKLCISPDLDTYQPLYRPMHANATTLHNFTTVLSEALVSAES